MAKLPTDAELAKLYHLGVSDKDIAASHGARRQGVNRRMVDMGLYRSPLINRRVNAVINSIWDVKNDGTGADTHHNKYAVRCLKTYMRMRLGDDSVSLAEQKKADRLIRMLVRDGTVIDYDRKSEKGWKYVPRVPSDGRRIIRWPEGKPLPEEEDLRQAMELPEETEDGGRPGA